MSIEKDYLERAKEVYKNMTLLELLSEENLMQKYLYNNNDNTSRKLHLILLRELNKKLN